jgi:hypothetical protein
LLTGSNPLVGLPHNRMTGRRSGESEIAAEALHE